MFLDAHRESEDHQCAGICGEEFKADGREEAQKRDEGPEVYPREADGLEEKTAQTVHIDQRSPEETGPQRSVEKHQQAQGGCRQYAVYVETDIAPEISEIFMLFSPLFLPEFFSLLLLTFFLFYLILFLIQFSDAAVFKSIVIFIVSIGFPGPFNGFVDIRFDSGAVFIAETEGTH